MLVTLDWAVSASAIAHAEYSFPLVFDRQKRLLPGSSCPHPLDLILNLEYRVSHQLPISNALACRYVPITPRCPSHVDVTLSEPYTSPVPCVLRFSILWRPPVLHLLIVPRKACDNLCHSSYVNHLSHFAFSNFLGCRRALAGF